MINENNVIDYAKDLISIASETPFDSNEAKRKDKYRKCMEAIGFVDEKMKNLEAKSEILVFEGGHKKWNYPVPNIYSEIHIGNTKAKNTKFICYMGHVDVVPVGDEKAWSVDPFSAKEKDGYIWGRGATDMKGSVVSWISALEELKASKNLDTNLIIGNVITADEEWAAVNGSDKVLKWLKDNGKEPDNFIVGEPSSKDHLGTNIKIGRRGSLVGYLEAEGIQGHRAYEDLFKNPNRALSYAMTILNAKEWKDGNKYFPNTTFEEIANKSGDFNASAIIPSSAKAMWNIRFTDKQSAEKLVKDLDKILRKPPHWLRKHPDYKSAKDMVTVAANLDTASLPYYSEPKKLANRAKEAIKEVIGVDAKFDGFGGTTDGRFIHKYFKDAEIIELGLPENGGIVKKVEPNDYKKRGGMHQIDERASVYDLKFLKKIYAKTMQNLGR